jgi:hypothetical protein
MTLAAHLGRNRFVDILKEYACLIGAVWIMAGRAASLRHWVIHVLFGKYWPIAGMAFQAQ